MDRLGAEQEEIIAPAKEVRPVRIGQRDDGRAIISIEPIPGRLGEPPDPVHDVLPQEVRARHGVIDERTERLDVLEPGLTKGARPAIGHGNAAGKPGPHPTEPLTPRGEQPLLQPGPPDPDVPREAPHLEPTLADGEHPTGPHESGQGAQGGLLVTDVVNNAGGPHQIGSGHPFAQPRIGKIPVHADDLNVPAGSLTHGSLSLGQQHSGGIEQHNGAPAPPTKLTSKEHAHATGPAPDIEQGRPRGKALDQPPRDGRERPGIEGIGHAQLSKPVGPVDVVMGVYGHHPIEHQQSRHPTQANGTQTEPKKHGGQASSTAPG